MRTTRTTWWVAWLLAGSCFSTAVELAPTAHATVGEATNTQGVSKNRDCVPDKAPERLTEEQLRCLGEPFAPRIRAVQNADPVADATREAVLAKLAARFAELDARLADRRYLAGEYSIADAYAFTIVRWSRPLRVPLGAYPNLQAYLSRVGERPAVRAALSAEGLLK